MICIARKTEFTFFFCPPAQKKKTPNKNTLRSACCSESTTSAAAGLEKVPEVSGNNSPGSRVSTSFSPMGGTASAVMIGPSLHTFQTKHADYCKSENAKSMCLHVLFTRGVFF